jgi:hypothetical protein
MSPLPPADEAAECRSAKAILLSGDDGYIVVKPDIRIKAVPYTSCSRCAIYSGHADVINTTVAYCRCRALGRA